MVSGKCGQEIFHNISNGRSPHSKGLNARRYRFCPPAPQTPPAVLAGLQRRCFGGEQNNTRPRHNPYREQCRRALRNGATADFRTSPVCGKSLPHWHNGSSGSWKIVVHRGIWNYALPRLLQKGGSAGGRSFKHDNRWQRAGR